MPPPPLSEAIQDYIKGIYKLQHSGGRVTVTTLARSQGVSPASASAMVKKLAVLDLLEHEPYRGARLTPAGEKVALEVIRHHRLLELYLADALGLHVDDVHAEADRLEHVISEELEERIDRALGRPTHDPHGDPIPDANLEWPAAAPSTRAPPQPAARLTLNRQGCAASGPSNMKRRVRSRERALRTRRADAQICHEHACLARVARAALRRARGSAERQGGTAGRPEGTGRA